MEPVFGVRRDPPPDLDAVGEDEALAARIRDEIGRDGPIPFARFMDLALYDPEGGYYRATEARPGRAGDFLTAPEIHPMFGWALAGLLEDLWRRLGEPRPFVLREHGAGTGTLALAILDRLERTGSALRDALAYDPVEVEPGRLETIEARLTERGEVHRLLDPDRRGRPVTGVVLANEVLDALPVHRVRRRGDRLVEVAVGLEDGAFADAEVEPSTPALAARLADEGIELVDGQTAEICLAVDRWVDDAAVGLERGLLLLIDYGAPAIELYDPVRRRDGTLLAYVRHRVSHDPYAHVGRQDLTAHVDVTAVERAAAAAGLSHVGDHHPGRAPDRPADRSAAARGPGGPGDQPRGVPRAAIVADAAARPGGDGTVPRDGLRARLAGRSAARRVRVPGPSPSIRRTAAGRLGRSTYCRSEPAACRLCDGRARPDGERRANLHARSAHAAPRRPRPAPRRPSPGSPAARYLPRPGLVPEARSGHSHRSGGPRSHC